MKFLDVIFPYIFPRFSIKFSKFSQVLNYRFLKFCILKSCVFTNTSHAHLHFTIAYLQSDNAQAVVTSIYPYKPL